MTQIFIEARYEKTSEYVFLNTIIKELGFSATLQRINQELQSNGMQADGIFLFPNNTDDGIFENLLEKLMQKRLMNNGYIAILTMKLVWELII